MGEISIHSHEGPLQSTPVLGASSWNLIGLTEEYLEPLIDGKVKQGLLLGLVAIVSSVHWPHLTQLEPKE